MDVDSLWKAFGHVVTAAVKHGEKQPGRDGDRRGGDAPGGTPGGSFGNAGTVRLKVGSGSGGAAGKPCCTAKRPGQR